MNRVSLDLNPGANMDRSDIYNIRTQDSNSAADQQQPYVRRTGLGGSSGNY